MVFRRTNDILQFFWMFESHHHQRLAWKDAAQARIARVRAEEQARAQYEAMLRAHPSGSMGDATLNDDNALAQSGLL